MPTARFAPWLLAVLLLPAALAAQPAADVTAIERFVQSELTRQSIPGVAVAVIRRGETVAARGFGLANVEHQVPVTRETIFQSGSVGKQFTAVAAMLLVEDGRLALDDALTTFLPEAPASWKRIRVRHLLTHTSGLPDYTQGTIDYRRDYTEDDLLKFAYGLTLEFEPGARWNYSNTGYVVLGIVIHKASGKFYGDVLRERVFAPLGMKTARVITEEDIVPHRAAGYRLVGKELKNQQWVAPKLNTTADGSLYLSLDDMIAWDAGIRAGKLLRPESWKQIFSAVALNSGKTFPYGFGWNVENVGTHRAHRHGGSWQGFQAYIARYPDDDLTIVVLSNLAQANPGRISDGIAALLDSTLTTPPLKPVTEGDPAIESRVRRLLADAAAGRLKAEDFGYWRGGFTAETAVVVSARMRQLGAVKSMTLMDARELGDDRIRVYDVEFEQRPMRLRVAIAPDGKITSFGVSPIDR